MARAKTWEWTITIHGTGETQNEAWADAEEQLMMDGLGARDIKGEVVDEDPYGENEDACQD